MTEIPPVQPASNAETAHGDQLNLLALFYYIIAGFIGLSALIPLIYVVIGIVLFLGGLTEGGEGAGAIIGGLFFMCGTFFCGMLPLILLALAAANAGRKLKTRQNHTYCVVVAAICCIFVPIGTVLGVFTLVVITKPEVKALFDRDNPLPVEVV